jgi:murein DD-endopeptidase MepM/ murein hydrolase activator NlpD
MQLCSPVAALETVGPEHETSGLPGYPAHDWFAPAGTAAISPAAGTVRRLSGHDPALGPTEGPHGPFGWSVYIENRNGVSFYVTHLGSRLVRVGSVLKLGDQIGTVGNYAKWGTPSHVHMGVHDPRAAV